MPTFHAKEGRRDDVRDLGPALGPLMDTTAERPHQKYERELGMGNVLVQRTRIS